MDTPEFPIDVVITYVDGTNQEWLDNYNRYGTPKPQIYWRTGKDMLRYFIKSIEMNLPFVNKIFLVVQNKSEVPEDLQSRVRVVTHDEFIPQSLLPTFNSITIETFLYRISDLSEHFLYVNDDEFVIRKLSWTDFYHSENVSRTRFEYFATPSRFRNLLKRTNNLIFSKFQKVAPEEEYNKMPMHNIRPYFKSLWRECILLNWREISGSLTRFRDVDKNYAYYMVDRYSVEKGRSVEDSKITVKHLSAISNIKKELETVNTDCLTLHDSSPKENIMDNIDVVEFMKARFE